MAAGFRSYAFWWFTGFAAGGGGPVEPGCPCPDWTFEGTLVDAFNNPNTVSTNQFTSDATLNNAFVRPDEQSDNAYTVPETLVNAWVRKACE